MAGPVATIIVNYNTADLTIACAKSVFATMPTVLVVVADNASRPEERSRLSAGLPERAQLLRLDNNYGFSVANNAGVRAVLAQEPEWLLFLNSDTQLCPGAIEQAIDAAEDHAVGAVGMRLLHASTPDIVQLGPGRFNPVTGHVRFKDINVPRSAASNDLAEVNFLHGGAMLVRTTAFLAAGMFPDDIFMYGEDVELALRLQQTGWRLVYQPAAEVLHHGGASGGGYMSPFALYHSTLSMWRVVKRNFPTPIYILHLLYSYLWFLPAFTGYCLLFRRQLVRPFLKAYMHHLRGVLNTPPVTVSIV